MIPTLIAVLLATPQIPVYFNGPYKPAQYPIIQSCSAGTALSWDGSAFSCVSTAGTVPGSACASGQALFWNGTAYSCVDSWVNTTGDTMTGTLTSSVAAGGTAMQLVTGARINLGSVYLQQNGANVEAWPHLYVGGNITTGTAFKALLVPATIQGTQSNSATAVGVIAEAGNAFTTAGAKLLSVRNAGTEKAYIDKDGTMSLSGGLSTGSTISSGGNYKFGDSSVQTTAIGPVTCAPSAVVSVVGNTSSCVSNVATATALLSNPTDCGAGTFADHIDANGNLTCSAWTHLLWGSQHTDVYTADTVAHGAMIYYAGAGDPPYNQNQWRLLYKGSTDDDILFSGGTSTAPRWVTLPDCKTTSQSILYDQSANTFTCNSNIIASSLANPVSITNASTASQVGFSADTYVTGSSLSLAGHQKAGTMMRWHLVMTKTAAGVAAPVFSVRFGTAGTTADTAQNTFTGTAQTAATDTATLDVRCTFRTLNSVTGNSECEFEVNHTGGTTGFSTTSGFQIRTGLSLGYDNTGSGLIAGLSMNGGASASWTVVLVHAEAINLN